MIKKKQPSLPLPPTKPRNTDVRNCEYLTAAEIKRLKQTASAACDVRWERYDLDHARLHVARLKDGDPATHYLEGDQIRARLKLKRLHTDSDFVFNSQHRFPRPSPHPHAR